ncbi:MAG: hypothetical protein A3H79_02940 [Candidatus Levybacteria bacterium RIFCSPLOWO2_02_FULL_36_8b]|nr:MAG: hypothetical protein A3H79_02940 [Candidatus Levybacteria bacterium RIFCSPLOWO2_02_FULL_36_8b]
MKSLLRNTVINGVSLYSTSLILNGVKIEGGFLTYIFAGFALTLMTFILKPVLNIIAFPINLVTFGMFSFLINAIILYILTIFIPQIKITSFVFKGFTLSGFVVPIVSFNAFFAFIAASVVLSFIISFIKWLTGK